MKKKRLKMLSALIWLMLITACGNNDSKANKVMQEQPSNDAIMKEDKSEMIEREAAASDVDVDLTLLSSTMVYSEVYNMMCYPENYSGKTVRMKGSFFIFENEETGRRYFACIISDAAACCAQGIEFELEGEHAYPDDYPEAGEDITVEGVFETYEEDGHTYCRLQDAYLKQ